MATDSFSDALGRLDPASRALLDLSLRRGMRPEEIGDLLGTDPESVIVARESALEQLAVDMGLDDATDLDGVRARLAELPGDAWVPKTPGHAQPEPEPEHADEPVAAEVTPAAGETAAADKPATAVETDRRTRLPLLLAVLAVAALALVALLVTRGSGDDKTSGKAPAAAAPAASAPSEPSKPAKATPRKPAARAAGKKVALAAVAGSAGGAAGKASLADGGKRLILDVEGLPEPGSGSYQVWLYNSVIDAESIGASRGRDLKMDLKLPGRASHFRSVDVSREPRDGNPNHSGQSVLRVPFAKLAR